MKLSIYDYLTESNAELFKFTSIGPKGEIKKLVVYSQMIVEDIYNLAFGDYIEESDTIDDKIITNNNDSQKVIATVASTLYVFFNKHPNTWVYATGSNFARNRFYQIAISSNLDDVLSDFEVYGLIEDQWDLFEKGKNFEAFLVKKK